MPPDEHKEFKPAKSVFGSWFSHSNNNEFEPLDLQILGSWIIAIGAVLLAIGLMQEREKRECCHDREPEHEHKNIRKPC